MSAAGPTTSTAMMQPKRYTYYGTGRSTTGSFSSSPVPVQSAAATSNNANSSHQYYTPPQHQKQPHSANPYASKRHSVHAMAGGSSTSLSSNAKPQRRQAVFGPYILGRTIGEGEFGKVKLAWSVNKKASDSNYYNINSNMGNLQMSNGTNSDDIPKQVAIKLIKMETIPKGSERETKIFREINALRLLTHPNIVQLEEVLQNKTHIGIVLEYASGGEFYKFIQERKRLKENQSCGLFAQLISGVHYMHSKGLVHRDLKLENLLLDKFENLIITDFGFVNEFDPGRNELMRTSCGSPCYAAPELVVSSRPYLARRADIWSCGIILFAMLAGYLPWDDDPTNPEGDDIAKLYMYITQTPLKFPEYIAPVPRDLLRRILVPNPKTRLSVRQIEQHQWLQGQKSFLSITPEEWDKILNQNKVYRPSQTKKKVVRPKSAASISSSGEKRNSLVLDNSYNVQPLPPQESQIFATVTDTSGKDKGNEQKREYVDVTSQGLSEPNPTFAKDNDSRPTHFAESHERSEKSYLSSPSNNRHRRTNSAASIVLQAVYDASESHSSELKEKSKDLSVDNEPRNLNTSKNTTKSKFQPSSKPRKPRPTSYQPSMSRETSDYTSSFTFPSKNMSQVVPETSFSEHDAMKENAKKEKQILEEKLRALKGGEGSDSTPDRREHRNYESGRKPNNSIIQEEDETEDMSFPSKHILDVEHSDMGYSSAQSNIFSLRDEKFESPAVTKPRIVSDASSISSPIPFNKVKLDSMDAATAAAAAAVAGRSSQTQSRQASRNLSGASANEKTSRRVSYKAQQTNSNSNLPDSSMNNYTQASYQQQKREFLNASHNATISNAPTTPVVRPTSSNVKDTKDKKTKRFSLLSFYSLYDNSKSSIDVEKSGSVSNNAAGAYSAPNSATTANSSRPVGSSSQRTASAIKERNKGRRVSSVHTSGSTGYAGHNTPVTPTKKHGDTHEKHGSRNTSGGVEGGGSNTPSTAKKVLDFFKRRSMR
ncbi:hypothetical protein ACO0QE_002404 [Hanseniaspora vineae]